MADNLSTVPVAESGYLPHAERPDAVNEALFEFLKGWKG
jgi:haloacetate dehalogenase